MVRSWQRTQFVLASLVLVLALTLAACGTDTGDNAALNEPGVVTEPVDGEGMDGGDDARTDDASRDDVSMDDGIDPTPPRADEATGGDALTPVVLFPGFATTRLEVQVDGQTAFPECPETGTFEWMVATSRDYPRFSQVCVDKLLTLVVDPDSSKPMAERISNQPGVAVSIPEYGTPESVLPVAYEPMFAFLERAGYERNANIRVAGHDSRLSPDLDGYLERTMALVEETYAENGNLPVHLVAYSQGNLFAHYLLTHTSQAWKDRHIHGLTAIASAFAGKADAYRPLFTGHNVNYWAPPLESENAASSAAMWQSWPWASLALPNPEIYQDRVVVIGIEGGKQYTAEQYQQMLRDAEMPLVRELADYYLGFVRFTTPDYFPNVDVYAERGTGTPTAAGVELAELAVGTRDGNVTDVYRRDGDGLIDDISGEAIRAWEEMECYHFELNDNPAVQHVNLPAHPDLLERLLTHLQRSPSECR